MHLDKHRPYGHVVGLPGVVFSQNGHFFDGGGRMVPNPEDGDNIVYSTAPPAGPVINADVPIPSLKVADDMRLAVNKALKKRMEEDFHEPWQGVEHARKFLGITE